MTVTVQTIQFDHENNSHRHDGVSIKKNSNEPILNPEWQAGITTEPHHSLVAYARDGILGNTVFIKAQFFSTDPNSVTCIQAINAGNGGKLLDTDSDESQGDLEQFLSILPATDITTVEFDDEGRSALVAFRIPNALPPNIGVGIYDIRLLWKCRVDSFIILE